MERPLDLADEELRRPFPGEPRQAAAPFSDEEFRVTNLYWRQRLADQRFVFLAGFLDATDFVDVYGLASPWLHFMNFAFSTGSQVVYIPNDAGLGLAVFHQVDGDPH